MPMTIFEAMRGNISAVLGGAEVFLSPASEQLQHEGHTISLPVVTDGREFMFSATRKGIPFTRLEESFCGELLTAFSMLSNSTRMAPRFTVSDRLYKAPPFDGALVRHYDAKLKSVRNTPGDACRPGRF